MPKGNPNPSPETRFTKGVSGNPGGLSKETKARIDEARDKAAVVYLEMINSLVKEAEAGSDDLVSSENLKLLKDVFDRSVGTPKATTEMSGPDGGAIPHSVKVEWE